MLEGGLQEPRARHAWRLQAPLPGVSVVLRAGVPLCGRQNLHPVRVRVVYAVHAPGCFRDGELGGVYPSHVMSGGACHVVSGRCDVYDGGDFFFG